MATERKPAPVRRESKSPHKKKIMDCINSGKFQATPETDTEKAKKGIEALNKELGWDNATAHWLLKQDLYDR